MRNRVGRLTRAGTDATQPTGARARAALPTEPRCRVGRAHHPLRGGSASGSGHDHATNQGHERVESPLVRGTVLVGVGSVDTSVRQQPARPRPASPPSRAHHRSQAGSPSRRGPFRPLLVRTRCGEGPRPGGRPAPRQLSVASSALVSSCRPPRAPRRPVVLGVLDWSAPRGGDLAEVQWRLQVGDDCRLDGAQSGDAARWPDREAQAGAHPRRQARARSSSNDVGNADSNSAW